MKKYLFLLSYFILSAQIYAESYSSITAQLARKFQNSFHDALLTEKVRLKNCPLITQDLSNMTLHTAQGLKIQFTMKKDLYKILAETSHIPLTIHNLAAKNNWQFRGELSSEFLAYLNLLKYSLTIVDKAELSPSIKIELKRLITLSINYLASLLKNKNIDQQSYAHYAMLVRPSIEKNLKEAAKNQIEQFHQQIQTWQTLYPDQQWSCLKVAILGIHDAREGYVLKQYFQWLLKESGSEKNVVYVEFPEIKDIVSDPSKSTQLALDALIKGNYQQRLAVNLMYDPYYLQHDVMAESAKLILDAMDG
ncbi:MAG: hypothetical protein H0U70_02165 [Tatlockia sp.]|nr:hypothetical protein [Tatlockia sp.]